MTPPKTILMSACLLIVAANAFGARLPLPPPPDAKVSWVGERMRLNGVDMKVRKFDTAKHITEVLDYYRTLWAQPVEPNQPAYGEVAMGPWAILTREQDGLLLSVHAALKERGTWGYLGISSAPSLKRAPKLGKDFPKMRGSAVVNDMQSNDAGAEGRTLMIINDKSIASNASFYRSHYEARGWTANFDRASNNGIGHVLAFQDGPNFANIVIRKENGQTYVTANLSQR